jgi:uncharacterized membrane protein
VRLIFWTIITVLVAIVSHLAYVLFVPTRNFSASLDEALKAHQINQFTVLDGAVQTKLMPFVSESDLVLLCKYDLTDGPVRLLMNVPEGYWTLAVYTIHGRQVYALNDRQADARSFSVKLSRARSFIEQLMRAGEDAEAELENIGWKVDVAEDRGLAFLWMPQADPWRRHEDMTELLKSSCARSAQD